jgi:hypothetical protein
VTFEQALRPYPEHWQDEARERAAIIEIDAGVPRAEAERRAIEMLAQRDRLLAEIGQLKHRHRKHGGPPR